MTKIYYSYAHLRQNDIPHNDATLVRKLKDDFKEESLDEVFLSYGDVSDEDIKEIQTAVDPADVVLFIFSAEAYADRHRYEELKYALEKNKRIIVISHTVSSFPEINDDYLDEEVWKKPKSEIRKDIEALQEKIKNLNWVSFDKYRLAKLGRLDLEKGGNSGPDFLYKRNFNGLVKAVYEALPTWSAFLSYARANNEYILPLRESIESLNEDLWFDNDDIPVGKDFLQEIFRGIEKSHNYICVVSNGWLASENCYAEFQYAKELNKRIIPVIYEHYNAHECLEIIKERGWRGASAEDALAQYSKKVWNEIEKLQGIIVDQLELPDVADNIVQCFGQERDYINQHTTYLVKAKAHELNEGPLLGAGEWLKADRWYRQHKKRENFAPNQVHQQYFGNSLGNFMVRGLGILGISLLVLGIIITLYFANIRTQAQAALDVAAEANERLQVLAQLNNGETFDVTGLRSRPLIAENSIWVLSSENTVERLQLNGLSSESYPTQIDPGQMLYGAGHVWVNNQGSATVTRINPDTDEIIHIETERSPQPPFIVGEDVWIHSMLTGRLQRLTGNPSPSIRIGLNTSSPVASNNHIWYLNSTNTDLNRVTQDGTIDTLGLDDLGQQLLYHESSNSLVVITTGHILIIDTESLQISQRIQLQASIATVYQDNQYIWAMLNDGTGIIRLTVASGELQNLSYANLSHISVTHNRVWLISRDGVAMLDKDSMTVIGDEQELIDAQGLLAPVSDGVATWFAYPQRDSVYLLSEEDGSLLRELSICPDALPPVFDNTRMWFSCRADQQVLSLPVDIYFFGERSTLDPLGSYPPFLIDDIAWFVQRGTGRIHIYDMQNQRHLYTFDLEAVILPLVYDTPYLWTVIRDTGELIRLDTSQFSSGADVPDEASFVRRTVINRPTSQISVFGDYIWLQTLFDSSDDVTLTVINKNTLEVVATSIDGDLAGPAIYYDGTVWLSSFDITQGYYSSVDPATGVIQQQYTFDNTPYASVVPVIHEGLLWFTPTLPSTSEVMFVVMDFSEDEDSISNLPFYFVAVDPATGEQVQSFRLPLWVDIPRFSGDYAWFDVVQAPTVANDAVVDYANAGFLVLNYRTGEVIRISGFCDNHADAYVANELGWLGCWQGEQSFTVYNPEAPDDVISYDALGEYPNEPLEVGNQIVFTFRHSGTIAMFDRNTGDLLSNHLLGDYPAEPFLYDDAIWVYSASSDTLQRINVTP